MSEKYLANRFSKKKNKLSNFKLRLKNGSSKKTVYFRSTIFLIAPLLISFE